MSGYVYNNTMALYMLLLYYIIVGLTYDPYILTVQHTVLIYFVRYTYKFDVEMHQSKFPIKSKLMVYSLYSVIMKLYIGICMYETCTSYCFVINHATEI